MTITTHVTDYATDYIKDHIAEHLPIICEQAPTPSYVIDQNLLKHNLSILNQVQQDTGAKILLALKSYAAYATFPLIKSVLHGICASSVNEAMLGRETFNKEVHVYSPAYKTEDITALLPIADHITFNRYPQWQQFSQQILNSGYQPQIGIRINPQHSEVTTSLYDPCAPQSRLGTTLEQLKSFDLQQIQGLHFHNLCQKNADALERTLAILEPKIANYLHHMQWLNFGGGHQITQAGYKIDLLCNLIHHFTQKYKLQIYLEPGEAVVLNTGYLITTVLDTFDNGEGAIAIIDASASAHMPDVIEMPYRPEIYGAGKPQEKAYTYRLGGQTCLAGDIIGDYSFDHPLQAGEKLALHDMAHYTMVKNNTFNGINLPSIAVYDAEHKKLTVVKSFGYKDYKSRL